MLDVRAIEAIEFIAANPLGSLFCCASCTDSGGKWATVLRDSAPNGLTCELGVVVGFVIGVGIEPGWGCLATVLKELKEETATSGDCGESKCDVLGAESGISGSVVLRECGIAGDINLLSGPDRSFSLVCSFNPLSLSVNFLPLTGETGVAGPVG